MIDTHTHLDGEEFQADLPQVIQRAKDAGVSRVLLPAISQHNIDDVLSVCRQYPHYAYPMLGLHPEEVRADWQSVLTDMHHRLLDNLQHAPATERFIAIGEVGLDYYWSREFADEQLLAFEEQVRWSIETRLPLMIHCRKAQNEMVRVLRRYEADLPGGVFHCFTGNQAEARELLSFPRFVLGIGGVLTFKSSHLREDLPAAVPLERIVLETDSPYMAPVPLRGQRNESANVALVMQQLAQCYGITPQEVERITDENVHRIFHLT